MRDTVAIIVLHHTLNANGCAFPFETRNRYKSRVNKALADHEFTGRRRVDGVSDQRAAGQLEQVLQRSEEALLRKVYSESIFGKCIRKHGVPGDDQRMLNVL